MLRLWQHWLRCYHRCLCSCVGTDIWNRELRQWVVVVNHERKDRKDETKTMGTDYSCVFWTDDRTDDMFQSSIFGS